MPRGRVAIALGVALVSLALALLVWAQQPADDRSTVDGAGHAAAACRAFERALAGVHANGAATEVFADLDRAARSAREAARRDAAYAQLASSILLVRHQMERDDPSDIGAALSLAGLACEAAEEPAVRSSAN